jgi:hypothetical protein
MALYDTVTGEMSDLELANRWLNAGLVGPDLAGTPATGLSASGSSRTDAKAITAWNTVNVFSTVSGGQGAVFPASTGNQWGFVQNGQGSNALQIYFAGSETVNGTAGSTGISIPANKQAFFIVPAAGKIYAIISA